MKYSNSNKMTSNSSLKGILTSALGAVLALSLLVNYSMFEKHPASSMGLSSSLPASSFSGERMGTRGIASIGPRSKRKFQKEKVRWNRSSFREALREAASVGTKPSDLDRLAFGTLEGKYAIRMSEGKIVEIRFSDAQNLGDRPKYVNDRLSFIDAHKSLFPMEFSEVRVVHADEDEFSRTEVYSLLDTDESRVGKIQFQMDEHGRLLSMRVIKGQHIASTN